MLKGVVPMLAGQAAAAAAAKYAEKFGGKSEGGNFSVAYGEPWTMQQYAAAAAVAFLGPKLLGKFLGKYINMSQFQAGAISYIAGKALWTEGISRSDTAKKWLGEIQDDSAYYDANGQGWMGENGQYVAMQGLGVERAESTLVQAGPMGRLVEAGPMGGFADYRNSTSTDPYAN